MTIEVSSKLRPCMVAIRKGGTLNKALFHCWIHLFDVVDASPFVGGHPGGQISKMYGIVEFEDGTIKRVYPESIRFLDSPFDEYDWSDKE